MTFVWQKYQRWRGGSISHAEKVRLTGKKSHGEAAQGTEYLRRNLPE
jgi:hypothetical protein